MSSILELARRLQALSQTGLHFAENPFDRERYEELARIAAEFLAAAPGIDLGNMPAGATADKLLASWHGERGYATPKIDVRGVVFKDDKILLVRERSDGKWTLPGGWADVNEQPREAVEKEIREESGYLASAVKLAALYDRDRHNPPSYLFHIWKVFFICDLVGGEPRTSIETDGVDFFPLSDLPPLSQGRTTAAQIHRMREHHLDRSLPADFE